MLLDGFNHVAILTNDTERLHAFYEEVLDARVLRDGPETPKDADVRLSIVNVGPHSELNVFQISNNREANRQTPMFGPGRIDHLALQADTIASFDLIRERLMARGSTDGFVTDFGPVLSVLLLDPDRLGCPVSVHHPH